jgi:hypothetical protein
MGFLDRLLGRKPADEPQTAPPPASMPEGDDAGGTTEHSHGEGEHDDSHEGEQGHEH